jgi:hypothetical protein
VSDRPRVISASHTPLVKFGIPPLVLWLGVRVAVGAARYLRSHEQLPPISQATIVACIVLFPFFAWSYLRLKRVALTDDALHISNFRREIVVPLRDVDRVRQNWFEMHWIVIRLARESEFGRRIVFIPKREFRRFGWTHPLVDHLRDAVAAAKKRELAPPAAP